MAKDIKVTLELDNSKFNRAIKQSEQQVKNFESTGTSSLFNIRNAFLAIGGGAVIRSIAQTGASFQDLQNSLNVVFGSVDAGADAFQRVQDFAATTQFSVQTLTQAFVQLKGAGVEPTAELLQTFADTASVTTDQMGTFQAALDLVSRSTAGGLGLEDLNRLADRGIPVFNILQERLNLTRLEVSEFGKTAEGANTIVRELLAGLNQRFGGALESQVGLLNFELNQLGDAFDNLQVALFGKVSDAAAGTVKALTDAINSLASALADADSTLNKVLSAIEVLGFAFVGFKLVTLPIKGILDGIFKFVLKLLNPMVALGTGVGTVATNFKNLGAVLKNVRAGISLLGVRGLIATIAAGAGSLVPFIAGFALLGTAVYKAGQFLLGFGKDTEEVTEVVKNNAHVLAFEAEQARLNEEAAKANAKQKELNRIAEEAFEKGLRSSTIAIEEQTSAFDKNDPLSSYQELLSDILATANETAVEQIFAAKAIDAVTDMYENGLLPMRTYELALERLLGLVGGSPFDNFIDKLDGVILTTEEYAQKQEILNALIAKYPTLLAEAERAQDALDEALGENEGLANFLDTIGRAQKRLSEDLATALMEGKSASESFKNFFKTLVNQMIADALRLMIIQPILSSLFGLQFGAGGSVTGLDFGGSLFGGIFGRANGGPVMANQPYIVGEKGPELMIPGQSGSIVPNSALGTSVTYNINAVDAPSFQALVASDPEFIYNVTRVGAKRLPGAR